jgi:hypothetical protein
VLPKDLDLRLYQRLEKAGFTGVEYDLFRADLVAYALPVLRSWISRKLVFSLCAQVDRPIMSRRVSYSDVSSTSPRCSSVSS